MQEYKTINWEGNTWYYKICSDIDESGFVWYWTEFYKEIPKNEYWEFWHFRIKTGKTKPNFKINDNIEKLTYSKEAVKSLLIPEFNKEKRRLEIEKGEII